MNGSELFAVWGPESSIWSPWVKPVLFAVERPVLETAHEAWRAAREREQGQWKHLETRDTTLVFDLPGARGLAAALACVEVGYRPIPLFNSCPGPAALVDNEPIRAGLHDGAATLSETRLPSDAPPAFALDSKRLEGSPAPAQFDNRWMVFPQDFPSAATLLAHGVRRVVLVQEARSQPRDDLAHVLLRWQRAGLVIAALELARGGAPEPIVVAKPSWFRWALYRVLVTARLRRNSAGGFGAVVPVPSQSSGFG